MLYYVPLESYPSRYTYQLTKWNTWTFDRLGVDYQIIQGDSTLARGGDIKVGQVLDVHNRTMFATSQIQSIVRLHEKGSLSDNDVLLFEDMYHPGLDALLYVFNAASPKYRPYVVMRCLAQTIDPDDFVNRTETPHYKWMRHYERMAAQLTDLFLVGSEEMLPNLFISGFEDCKFSVTGLPFNSEEVRSHVSSIPAWGDRENSVVFASRLDAEKQPDFYARVALEVKARALEVKFYVLAGKPASSNVPGMIDVLVAAGVTILDNLPKSQYYERLAKSRVLFNCALQDWYSNTISEADALGTNVVAPAYRSFPEALENDATRLYVPWSVDQAADRILENLKKPSVNQGRISKYADRSIERSLLAINARQSKPLNSFNYREQLKHRRID